MPDPASTRKGVWLSALHLMWENQPTSNYFEITFKKPSKAKTKHMIIYTLQMMKF